MRPFSRAARFLLLFATLPMAANASEDACKVELPVDASSSRECPSVFGDEQIRTVNAERRDQLLELIREGRFVIELVHAGDWKEPTPIAPKYIDLIEALQPPGCPGAALVRLDAPEDLAGCPPGFYRIDVDDSLGEQTRILAILDDVVLLEHEGDLRYLSSPGTDEPVWRMAWHPPWSLPAPTKVTSSTSRHKRRAARRNRRHRRNRRR